MNKKAVYSGWRVLFLVLFLMGACCLFVSWLALPNYLEIRYIAGQSVNALSSEIVLISDIVIVLSAIAMTFYVCKNKTNDIIVYLVLALGILFPIIGTPLLTFFVYGQIDLYGVSVFFITILLIQLFPVLKSIEIIKQKKIKG